MAIIKYKGKEYRVSDRIDNIIEKFHLENNGVLDIFETTNYRNGKISEPILILYLIDTIDSSDKEKLLILLESKMFAKGLISYDVISKFARSYYLYKKWNDIDLKLEKGIISKEIIKLICKMVEEDNEYLDYFDETLGVMVELLTSKEYEQGMISEPIIKLMGINNALSDIKRDIISEILELNLRSILNDRILKPILEEEKELICLIILEIIGSELIDSNEKENYILAMLNTKNKEKLLNIYNLNLKEGKIRSMHQFAQNFVENKLPLLETSTSYKRKKVKPEN